MIRPSANKFPATDSGILAGLSLLTHSLVDGVVENATPEPEPRQTLCENVSSQAR